MAHSRANPHARKAFEIIGTEHVAHCFPQARGFDSTPRDECRLRPLGLEFWPAGGNFASCLLLSEAFGLPAPISCVYWLYMFIIFACTGYMIYIYRILQSIVLFCVLLCCRAISSYIILHCHIMASPVMFYFKAVCYVVVYSVIVSYITLCYNIIFSYLLLLTALRWFRQIFEFEFTLFFLFFKFWLK